MDKIFKPHHINATQKDMEGNHGIGRYILLPGSVKRAQSIAQYFDNLTINPHPRGHDCYLGTIKDKDRSIDVATIPTGIGCPSMEIILHELYHLGAKRFLRVGTAGSLQPDFVKVGDIVNAQASVRDEDTTIHYTPLAFPAIASFEFTSAVIQSVKKLSIQSQFHTGVVHCKGSLYAREFGVGPKNQENMAYIQLLTQCGVLASEMETAALFIQSQIYNYQSMLHGKGPQHRVLCAAILGILSASSHDFVSPQQEAAIETKLIELALESIKTLAADELV